MKVIFSDFDKTLVDRSINKGSIPSDNLDILRKLKRNSVKFSIVSGRCLSFFKENYLELMDVVSYFVSSNGSSIYDVFHNDYIYRNFIDSNSLKKIYDCAKKYGLSVFFNLLDKRLYFEQGSYQYFDFDKINCEQVVLIGNIECWGELIDDIKQIEDVVINNRGKNPDVGSFFIDINRKGVSKGNAISYLCDYLKVDKNDAICFGDSDNDFSMFQVVGSGIAVENASELIKTNADVVIGTVWEDSVFRYVDDNFNKEGKNR